jgi:hypothetical protein
VILPATIIHLKIDPGCRLVFLTEAKRPLLRSQSTITPHDERSLQQQGRLGKIGVWGCCHSTKQVEICHHFVGHDANRQAAGDCQQVKRCDPPRSIIGKARAPA